MKLKKLLALSMASLMAFSVVGCGSSSCDKADNTAADTEKTDDAASDDSASADGIKKYTDIELGKDYTDLTATIKVLNHRTDMADADYPGKNWDAYIEEFNKMYPNITVDIETITDYANETSTSHRSRFSSLIRYLPIISGVEPDCVRTSVMPSKAMTSASAGVLLPMKTVIVRSRMEDLPARSYPKCGKTTAKYSATWILTASHY